MLDREDQDSLDLEQALRWIRTYAELLDFSVRLQADQPRLIAALTKRADSYAGRLTFWNTRCRAIVERYP